MVLKPFKESLMTLGLRALVKRLPSTHPAYAKTLLDLQQAEAGDNGESFIMRQLEKLSDSLDVILLHNITIKKPVPMQLDIVIVTPYEVFIVESKNIRGHVQLKTKPRQMIRLLDSGEKNIFNHPEVQLEEYVYGLQQFFKQHRVSANVNGLIVFPFNNAMIDYEDGLFPVLVIRELAHFLRLRAGSEKRIDSQLIGQLLLRYHQPYMPFPLCKYYQIDRVAIKPGVFCPSCQFEKMERVRSSWHCPNCRQDHPKAHIQALKEYSMLIDNEICNHRAQSFMQLDNRHTVKRLLQDTCFLKTGKKRTMKYRINQ